MRSSDDKSQTGCIAKTKKTKPQWSIINQDARLFEIPPDANLFYFFNPFDAIVMGLSRR